MKKLLSAMLALMITSPVMAEDRSDRCIAWAEVIEAIHLSYHTRVPREDLLSELPNNTPWRTTINAVYATPLLYDKKEIRERASKEKQLFFRQCMEDD